MTEPILRIPLSEAEAHRAELAAALKVVEAARWVIATVVDTETGIPLRQSVVHHEHDPAEPIDVVATVQKLVAKVLDLSRKLDEAYAHYDAAAADADAATAAWRDQVAETRGFADLYHRTAEGKAAGEAYKARNEERCACGHIRLEHIGARCMILGCGCVALDGAGDVAPPTKKPAPAARRHPPDANKTPLGGRMTEPILRIPFSEAEAHRAELARAKARVAELEHENEILCASVGAFDRSLERDEAAASVSLEDIRILLLDEANEDTGTVRACLEGDNVDGGDINVVDTIVELCAKVRHLAEQLATSPAAVVVDDSGCFVAPEADRIAAVKAHLATKKPAPAAKPVDTRPHVATRRDAHGRRFWDGSVWCEHLDIAVAFGGTGIDPATKPRGSRLVALDDVPALLAEDAAKDAAKASAPVTPLSVLA